MKKRNTTTNVATNYGEDFYDFITDDSLKSGLIYAGILSPIINPNTVVDLGCGRGTWLKAFKENGASELAGFDGPWIRQEDMIDPSIQFSSIDLDAPKLPLSTAGNFDLAISLEVAEHLEPASAKKFVEPLTNLSDVVLFSAAYIKQGGKKHINEQRHTYWASLFSDFDYIPYDLFRPIVWGNSEVPYWYQQNAFLYVRNGSKSVQILHDAGHTPLKNISFMDCVHPQLYEVRLKVKTKKLIKILISRAFGRG